jgi:16S rRNA (cytidine1402-2'-O)-methyltransferase
LPGTLYVVSTPIGNLEDVTLRALRVLREVKLIAAEDTRRTAKLLSHYSIATPTTSLHEHNELQKTPHLVDRLRAGDDIALVSDAGTPLLSDPGAHAVSAAREAGIPVVAVPGPSALLTALAASGLPATEFTFLGYPPRKAKALEEWVERAVKPDTRAVVFYEAPHRIRQTLETIRRVLGDIPIVTARELTKIHEELVVQPISASLARLAAPRGEFTVVIPPRKREQRPGTALIDPASVAAEVGLITENRGLSPRKAAGEVARRLGLSANEVYRLARLHRSE